MKPAYGESMKDINDRLSNKVRQHKGRQEIKLKDIQGIKEDFDDLKGFEVFFLTDSPSTLCIAKGTKSWRVYLKGDGYSMSFYKDLSGRRSFQTELEDDPTDSILYYIAREQE